MVPVFEVGGLGSWVQGEYEVVPENVKRKLNVAKANHEDRTKTPTR